MSFAHSLRASLHSPVQQQHQHPHHVAETVRVHSLIDNTAPIDYSVIENIEHISNRVQRVLHILNSHDKSRPVHGGLNETGLKLLFIAALQLDNNWHIEAEFELSSKHTIQLFLTPKQAPFDVCIVFDIRYSSSGFILSKAYADADVDNHKFEALKALKPTDLIKLKVAKSGYKGPVNVAQVLLDSSNTAKSHAKKLLKSNFFPCIISVGIVGVGPGLVSQIEATGEFAQYTVPRPVLREGIDFNTLKQRVHAALSQLKPLDADCEARRTPITFTAFKLLFAAALIDSGYFLQSNVSIDINISTIKQVATKQDKRRNQRHSADYDEEDDLFSISNPRNHSLHGLAAQTLARIQQKHKNSNVFDEESESEEEKESNNPENSQFSSASTTGPIPLLLLNNPLQPSNAVLINSRYFHINHVYDYDVASNLYTRLVEKQARHSQKHLNSAEFHAQRKNFFSQQLNRIGAMNQNELESMYVSNSLDFSAENGVNPSTSSVQTLGSIARNLTALTFKQGQLLFNKYSSSLRVITLITAVGIANNLIWLQETLYNPLFNEEFKAEKIKNENSLIKQLEKMNLSQLQLNSAGNNHAHSTYSASQGQFYPATLAPHTFTAQNLAGYGASPKKQGKTLSLQQQKAQTMKNYANSLRLKQQQQQLALLNSTNSSVYRSSVLSPQRKAAKRPQTAGIIRATPVRVAPKRYVAPKATVASALQQFQRGKPTPQRRRRSASVSSSSSRSSSAPRARARGRSRSRSPSSRSRSRSRSVSSDGSRSSSGSERRGAVGKGLAGLVGGLNRKKPQQQPQQLKNNQQISKSVIGAFAGAFGKR
jgi:hypothetical protein